MLRLTRLLIAVAAAGIALPAAAQSSAPPKMEADRTGQETPVKAKTPEQIAKEKADKEKIRADAMKKGPTKAEADRAQMKGSEVPAKAKTPEQIAKEKADKAKRGVTPEDQAKQQKQSPGN